MSKHSSSNEMPGESVTLETGIEALQSSPEFRGPIEDLDGHYCNDHFAHIYESHEEKLRATIPFIRHGLERGERILYVVDESTESEVRTALRDANIDVDVAAESGAFSFHTVQETYLRNGSFDVDEMIDFYGDMVDEVTDEYGALRIVAEMTWLEDDETSIEQFMEYEQRINGLFAETESLAICQYNRDRFAPEAIRNVVQTHPHLIYDGAACHNFYYTPPEEFFGDDAPARENDRMLQTLRERTVAKAELQRHERILEELYEVTADPERSFMAKIRRLLEVGRDRFGLENGYFNRINGDTVEIAETVGPHDLLEQGATDPISESYCGKLLDSNGSIAVLDAADAGWTDDDTAYETFGFDAYFGTIVHVGGEEYGTLCFASDTPRDEPFTDAERTFLDLMGQWVEYELERQRRERFLHECYTITSDPDRGFEAKIKQLLDLARDWMNLDAAGLTHLPEWGGKFLNEFAVGYGEDADGKVWTNPDEGHYCRAVIASEKPVGKADIRGTPWEDDPIHQEHSLSCYLGTKVMNGSTPYGTLWVGSPEPRDRTFSETEQTFLELIGQWVSYELERREYNEAQRTLNEITSDPDRGFDEKLDALFDLGRDRFGFEYGGLARIDPDRDWLEVQTIRGDHDHLEQGKQPTLSETHCRLITDDTKTVSVTDAEAAGLDDTTSYQKFGVDAYLGTRLALDDGPDAAFFFFSEESRDREFSEAEHSFHHLMGQWVQYELDRQQRERALRESEEQLRALIDVLPIGVFVAEADGEIVEWNDAAEDIWGGEVFESDSVAEYDAYDGWWADTGEPVAPEEWPLARALDGEEVTDPDEIEIEGFDGERRTILNHGIPVRDADGEVCRAVITLVDITERRERKQAQRELYEITADADLDTDAKIERLLELGSDYLGLPVGMLNHDRGEGLEIRAMHGDLPDVDEGSVIPPTSEHYCREVVETDELIAIADANTADWNDDPLYTDIGLTAYAGAPVTVDGQTYGTLCFADTSACRTSFTEAEQSFLDLMGQYVSYELERKQRERALEESNERLEQFAYAASHDLQEPLRMVTSYLQLLENRYSDAFDEDGEEFLEFAVDGADRMREMINGLLEYSRVETRGDPFEQLELDAVLGDALADLQIQIEETDAEITSERLPCVEGDASQLRQVFQNLLSNALSYSGDDPPQVHIDAERRGEEWVISVDDNGIGIDPEDQDRVFSVFDRLHSREEYEGTGLGLALCQRIVERHDGEIWVDSEPGEGSTFSFTLPAR